MFDSIKYKNGETFYSNATETKIFNWRNGVVYTYKRSHFCFTELKEKSLFIKLYFMVSWLCRLSPGNCSF